MKPAYRIHYKVAMILNAIVFAVLFCGMIFEHSMLYLLVLAYGASLFIMNCALRGTLNWIPSLIALVLSILYSVFGYYKITEYFVELSKVRWVLLFNTFFIIPVFLYTFLIMFIYRKQFWCDVHNAKYNKTERRESNSVFDNWNSRVKIENEERKTKKEARSLKFKKKPDAESKSDSGGLSPNRKQTPFYEDEDSGNSNSQNQKPFYLEEDNKEKSK